MASRRLLSGSSYSLLEARAFDTLNDVVGDHPNSVLYLADREHPQNVTIDRWSEYGPSAALRVDSIDGIVSEFFEGDTYKGPVTNIDQPLLDRLVELGVERIESSANPLYSGDYFPRSGLVEAARTLYTELEFAGLLTPSAMRQRLETEGVPDRAANVEELAEAIDAVRTEMLADELRETYRSERLHHVTVSSTPLDEIFPSVDAVVLGGFTRLDPLEEGLVERIADAWPTIALLPLQVDDDAAAGVDAGAAKAIETYRNLGFSYEYHPEPDSGSRRAVTRNLYRHPDDAPAIEHVDAPGLDVSVVEVESVSDEIRAVARDVRTRLAEGANPDDIGVVLTNPSTHAERVREILETYDLHVSLETEIALPETALGEVVRSVCELAREPRSVEQVLELVTNPVVEVRAGTDPIDHRTLARAAARTESDRLDSTLEHVDGETAAAIESLLDHAASLTETPLDDLPDQVEALLERLGVSATLDGNRDIPASLQARERDARDSLDRVLETLALTAALADLELGDSVDRLERAIQGASIGSGGRHREDAITVCGLAEAVPREFEHAYVLGMTSTHFPTDPERTAFARPIYESHPDFEQTDVSAEARYHFGALLGSDASLHLSIPQRNSSGEPFVEADVVTELRRLIDLEEITVESTDPTPGCQEDVQRTIGRALPDLDDDRVRRLLDDAVEAETFTKAQASRIDDGIACASARAHAGPTRHDGQLTPETVSEIHDTATREPYSASRLETYAACGFKYYMRRVLRIKAPDEFPLEPDASDRGTYVHDVLERYYRSFQSAHGEPVEPGGDLKARQRRLLEIALDRLDEVFGGTRQSAFQDEWLTRVLAGLGTPETNPYFSPDDEVTEGQPHARGLLYRFLEHEADEPAKTTARPAWFEARVGDPYDAGTSIQREPGEIQTPAGPIEVYGLIDRIDVVPGTEPTQIVVRDYKTGSRTPSERDALLGLKAQLPLYALLAEDALDSVETVGGAYYQVSPPTSVNSRSGLLTSQEMAVYHGSDDVETPLLRHSYPHFETHEAFRRYVEETATEQLGDIAAGIGAGHYQPTVLDPADAGCRYCDYAHVCDVRSHRRREAIEEIDGSDVRVYVPSKARDLDPEDVTEVE